MIIILIIVIVFATTNKKEDDEKNENLIDNVDAVKILGQEITKKNNNLLNESLDNINELILISNNKNFIQINIKFDEVPKNLDFLKYNSDTSLILAIDDIYSLFIRIW